MLMFIGAVDYIFVVLAGLIGIFILGLFLYKGYIGEFNRRSKRKKIDSPLKASELARANLDKAGLTDVEVVVKLFTSGYKHNRKKLYITRAMERKATVYSIAKVMQLVSMAIIYHTDANASRKYWGSTLLSWGATALFFLLIIVSIIVELSTPSSQASTIVLILTVLSLIFYIFTAIYSLKKGNLLKQANEDAKKYVANMGIFTDNDILRINKMYTLSIKEYKIDKFLSIIYVIYYALKLIAILLKAFLSKK